ncbi:serine protease inhibitor [Arthrobacter sp. UKPF54-2]|uniref:serine protease inhibitor n=1 Tax=Arthrobacter sp. UKPF54-2 TaxID=2600159 RepID=UPI0011B176AE|nr:serine protease inhibitor [Arthrobacter sp. UKPF54-2]QDY89369.1 serine protease inhibitor [Arthrobacter sp. UKPF54-2]
MTAPAQGNAPHEVDLTVRLTEGPGAPEYSFRLIADGGIPGAGSTLPDPVAALEALRLHGEAIFFPVPGPPKLCTQQYGGPQVAVVTGHYRGREVHCEFSRTDGCEIARWRALAPVLGGIAGSTGAV